MHIELGDDERYNATIIGIVTFEREKASPLHLKDVMFILVLKKNLIFVEILEDRGYDVVSIEGKAFLRHKTTGQAKIVILFRNIYKLDVYGCTTLMGKADKVVS